MSIILFLFIVAVVVYLIFWVFVPLGRGALYEPSSPDQTALIAHFADVHPGMRTADLGSGDGRIVMALARQGAEAHGYEVNPILVILSRRNIRRAGLDGTAFIHWKSFWSADLSGYRIITVFQVDYIMPRLEKKVIRELSSGACIVSHHWRFPTLDPEILRSDIYLYRLH
jgi:hypothetical protein